MMNKISEEVIEKMTREILEDTDLMSVPIDIAGVAKFYGFSLFKKPMEENESGLIIVYNEKIKGYNSNKLIIVNENDSPRRKRFTIAHELGHFFLNGVGKECFAHRDVGDYGESERDANRFASALLMPKKDIEQAVAHIKEEYPKCPQSLIVSEVARAFWVSQSAAEVRLKRLGAI